MLMVEVILSTTHIKSGVSSHQPVNKLCSLQGLWIQNHERVLWSNPQRASLSRLRLLLFIWYSCAAGDARYTWWWDFENVPPFALCLHIKIMFHSYESGHSDKFDWPWGGLKCFPGTGCFCKDWETDHFAAPCREPKHTVVQISASVSLHHCGVNSLQDKLSGYLYFGRQASEQWTSYTILNHFLWVGSVYGQRCMKEVAVCQNSKNNLTVSVADSTADKCLFPNHGGPHRFINYKPLYVRCNIRSAGLITTVKQHDYCWRADGEDREQEKRA